MNLLKWATARLIDLRSNLRLAKRFTQSVRHLIMASVYHKNFAPFLVVFCAVQCTFAFYVFNNIGVSIGVVTKNMSAHFLDVGQGDATYIVAPNGNSLLIDFGPPNKKVLSSLSSIVPFFNSRIDATLATHPDNDHVGSIGDVFDKYNSSIFLYNGVVAKNKQYKSVIDKMSASTNELKGESQSALNNASLNTLISTAQKFVAMRGVSIVLDKEHGVVFKILSPSLNDILENYEKCIDDANSKSASKNTIKKCKKFLSVTTNDSSIVGRLTYGDTRVMLTGDASVDVEKSLIENLPRSELTADILKIGHHGSKTSTSLEFLQAVRPEFAIVSAGQKNSYGHPHKAVLDNLKTFGITPSQILRTDEVGSITFHSDSKRWYEKSI